MKTTNRKSHRKNRCVRFESLEDRRMMSADVVADHALALAHHATNAPETVCVAAPAEIELTMLGPERQTTSLARTVNANRAIIASSLESPATAAMLTNAFATPTDGAVNRVFSWVKNAGKTVYEGASTVVSTTGKVLGTAARVVHSVARLTSPIYYAANAVSQKAAEGVTFHNVAKISAKDLQPGDILVLSGTGAMRSAIRGITGWRFNHAALYVGNGQVIDATDGEGVSRRSLDSTLDSTQRFVAVLRRPGLTAVQQDAIVREAECRIGSSYSYLSCSGSALGFIAVNGSHVGSKTNESFMCSEFVQKVYSVAVDYQITARYLPSPGDLAMAPGLNLVGKLVHVQE